MLVRNTCFPPQPPRRLDPSHRGENVGQSERAAPALTQAWQELPFEFGQRGSLIIEQVVKSSWGTVVFYHD